MKKIVRGILKEKVSGMGPGETVGETTHRAIIPGKFVNVTEDPVRVAAPQKGPDGDEPQLEFIREGDVILAIEVTCGCGRKMRLLCQY